MIATRSSYVQSHQKTYKQGLELDKTCNVAFRQSSIQARWSRLGFNRAGHSRPLARIQSPPLSSLINSPTNTKTRSNSCYSLSKPRTIFHDLETGSLMSERAGSVESATDTVDLPAIPSPPTISTHSLSLPHLPPTLIEREGSHSSVTDGVNELNGSGSNTPNFGEGEEEVDSLDEAEVVLEQHELSAFGVVGAEDDGLPPPPKPDGGKGEKKGPHNALSAAARAKRPPKNIKTR